MLSISISISMGSIASSGLILIERENLIEPEPGSRVGGAGGRTVRFVPARGAPVGRRMVIVRIGG